MPDNPIHFVPSPGYQKPHGRGSSSGGGGGGGSGGYSKPNHRGRGRGSGGMSSDRSQQGDNRGTPDMRNYQALHSQQAGISNTTTGSSNYTSNMYPSGGAGAAANNYGTSNYNPYRGRDSRSSWDGGSNSSKKGGVNYNHHSSPVGGNHVPFPQSISTTVPSNTNVPTTAGTGFISPQYYASGQLTGYGNNGVKTEASPNVSQMSSQSTPSAASPPINSSGTSTAIVSLAPTVSVHASVQVEKVPVAVVGHNVPNTVSGGAVLQKSQSPTTGLSNSTNTNVQSQSVNTTANKSPSKPIANPTLPAQTASSNSSASNISQPTPVVVSTNPQSVVSQQSSNNPSVAHLGGSQRPTRGASDESNNGASGAYQGHNTGYYQNYHPKSSTDLSKDGGPM